MSVMQERTRTAMLVGEEALERLKNARVAIFGVGGVGGYICEALARAGVGALDIFDHDTVSLSNINRQIVALHSTVGALKVDVMAARLSDIAPDCRVRTHPIFYTPQNADTVDLTPYHYIADAIDTVSAKLELATRSTQAGIPLIAAMGTGNKLDPTRFRITDISKTNTCPLAKVMRTELRRRGISHLKVLWSDEPPRKPIEAFCPPADTAGGRIPPASIATLPSVAGLLIANEILLDLMSPNRVLPQKISQNP